MSRGKPPVTCDGPGCGKQKQESNHWWVIGVMETRNFGKSGTRLLIGLSEPEDVWDERFTLYDACGQDCALKFISEQMGKGRGPDAK